MVFEWTQDVLKSAFNCKSYVYQHRYTSRNEYKFLLLVVLTGHVMSAPKVHTKSKQNVILYNIIALNFENIDCIY